MPATASIANETAPNASGPRSPTLVYPEYSDPAVIPFVHATLIPIRVNPDLIVPIRITPPAPIHIDPVKDKGALMCIALVVLWEI
jgi:hypothetical protein